MKNFRPNIIIVTKVVIDEPNKYKPQPTSHIVLLLNVIKERIPLINPIMIRMIVNAKLIFIINDC